MRVSVKARTTAAFAAVMLVLLGAIAALAYTQMSAALLDEIDTGLRFRAVTAVQSLPAAPLMRPDHGLQEPTEAFEQVLATDGTLLSTTAGFTAPALRPTEVAAIHTPKVLQRAVPAVEGPTRLLAVPVERAGKRVVLVIGASMSDRTDALHDLAVLMLIGGPIAVAVACLAAWLVAGWVLRPMDRLRAQAAAITASGTDRRLTVPRTRDEIQRLALTLNEMLDRLASSMAGERAFLERAGHELRTPLAALRAEVDLALLRRRTAENLEAALRSVSEETDRLARLADDLLVLARAANGRLPLHREPTPLRPLLDSAAAQFAAQARQSDVSLSVDAVGEGHIVADPLRVRQVLTNLLANALRHTPERGHIRLAAGPADGGAWITVEDDGPGFDLAAVNGLGLGLQIVRAIVAGHGGTLDVDRGEWGGAVVTVTVPHTPS
jgi:two-component system OmpR family sensor kinase